MLGQSPADLTASFRQVVGVGGTLEFLENLMESKNWLAAMARTFEALECRVFVVASRMAVIEPDGAEPPAQLEAPMHDDAELIALCGEFDDLRRQIDALFEGPGRIANEEERDVAAAPLEAAQDALVERICAMRASTIEGYRARLVSAALYDPSIFHLSGEGFPAHRMVGAVIRDLIGEGV